MPVSVATATPSPSPEPVSNTAYGFVRFPFDLSGNAVNEVNGLVDANADFTAFHLDLLECVPWSQMLSGQPLPDWMVADFASQRSSVPSGQFATMAITPTAQNRVAIAAQCGEREGEQLPLPPQIANADFDDPDLIRAFDRYVEEAIAALQPRYLILGIEISELALNEPARWEKFAALYASVQERVKRDHPDLPVGPEMVLQTLMLDRVGEQVKPLVESADFLSLSFYPYATEFGEAQGAPALPAPPEQWREPFRFLRSYTSKAVAIAETGYATRDFQLETVPVSAAGSEELQQLFVTDLVAEAEERDWLFVVWFVPVDYPALTQALGATGSQLDLLRIWEFTGLWRPDRTAKPALSTWQAARAR